MTSGHGTDKSCRVSGAVAELQDRARECAVRQVAKERQTLRNGRIIMLIAYLTTDEVNQYLAMQMAEECGQTLCLLSLSHAAPDGVFDAAVYDLDHLPARRQQALLGEMLAGRAAHPMAVHSYNLADECVEALRGHA